MPTNLHPLWLGPLVLVRSEPPGQVTAQIVGLPELQATAATRDEALEGVRQLIDQWLASGRLVPLQRPAENPWRGHAGWAKDDPEYGEFLEQINRQRLEMDSEAVQE